MLRSRLKSLVKRALKSDTEKPVRSTPRASASRSEKPHPETRVPPEARQAREPPPAPPPPAREPSTETIPGQATRFAALASAAAQGTLDLCAQEITPEVTNASSESSEAGQVLTIDQDECISCGTCVENTDQNFFLASEGPGGQEAKAEVIAQSGHWDQIQDAIDACPVMCIDWLAPDEVGPNHSGSRTE